MPGTDFIELLPVVVVVAVLLLACRWVFSSRGVRRVVARPDYGLLVPVARADTAALAELMRRALAEHGIRGTVAPAGKGFDAKGVPWPAESHFLLVFPADVEQAEQLVASRS